MQMKTGKWICNSKNVGIALSLLIIGGCSGELDPDRIYSDQVPTSDLSISVVATISDDARWARLFLDMQPSKECPQTTGKSVLISEGDELTAHRSAQSNMLTIVRPVPGSSAYTYKLTDLSPETPSAWNIRFTRNSGQEVYENKINISALPDIEAPKNGTQYGPDDVLIFSWSTLLFTESNTAETVVDELRVRLSNTENGIIHRLPIGPYLQNRDIAYMEVPVADIVQKLGQTTLPIEFDYALSINDAIDPEVLVKYGLTKEIDEDLARLCETGISDLTVRQSWQSIGVSNNVQIAF